MGIPRIASPWRRIVELPDHHVDGFCLFRDHGRTWHCIGTRGGGTWESERSFFHFTGRDLTQRFTRNAAVLTAEPAPPTAPQKGGACVVEDAKAYHLFYRRPPGTILHVASPDPYHWPEGSAEEVFSSADARDPCVVRIGRLWHMVTCEAAEAGDATHSSVVLRTSQHLTQWSPPRVIHADTERPTERSYLESPHLLARPEGCYLFLRHRLLDDRSATVVHFSRRADRFRWGPRRWVAELADCHAAEIVTTAGATYIARASGAPHARPGAPAGAGWVEIAVLEFA